MEASAGPLVISKGRKECQREVRRNEQGDIGQPRMGEMAFVGEDGVKIDHEEVSVEIRGKNNSTERRKSPAAPAVVPEPQQEKPQAEALEAVAKVVPEEEVVAAAQQEVVAQEEAPDVQNEAETNTPATKTTLRKMSVRAASASELSPSTVAKRRTGRQPGNARESAEGQTRTETRERQRQVKLESEDATQAIAHQGDVGQPKMEMAVDGEDGLRI